MSGGAIDQTQSKRPIYTEEGCNRNVARKKREEKKKGRDKIMNRIDTWNRMEEMRLHKTELRDELKKTRRDKKKKDQKIK